MPRRTILTMIASAVVASAIGIFIALQIPWFPDQAATQAGPVDTLYHVLLFASVPIFVFVETFVIFCVWKFRMRPGQEDQDGPPIHGNTRLEVLWTALPAALLLGLCTYSYTVLHKIEKKEPNTMRVDVIAQQFAWRFEYPAGPNKKLVADQLYVPKDRPIIFRVHSVDVVHDFWVPEWRIKTDAVPGITTHIRITPDKLGRYPVVCQELCGLGHATMRSTVHIMRPQAFRAWRAKQTPQPGTSGAITIKSKQAGGGGTAQAGGA